MKDITYQDQFDRLFLYLCVGVEYLNKNKDKKTIIDRMINNEKLSKTDYDTMTRAYELIGRLVIHLKRK